MQQVWKCNFCYFTNPDQDIVKGHEKDCDMDPSKKDCDTCKYQLYDGYPFGGPHVCDNKESPFYTMNCDAIKLSKKELCQHWEED